MILRDIKVWDQYGTSMGPVNTHGVFPRREPISRASLGMAGCQCQLMRQTASVEICWQQGREDGGEVVEWV